MKPYVVQNGWMSEAFGHPVRKVDLTYLDHTRWASGAPRGPFWHGQAGCGGDLTGTMQSRGYAICSFNIDVDGVIRQYIPLGYSAHHAYDASSQYVGVEHAILPGSCGNTKAQYDASVALFAALTAYCGNEVEHNAGCGLSAEAIKEHHDGVGCEWNPNTHTDGLDWAGGPWTWSVFLQDIRDLLGGEGKGAFMALTDEEQARMYAISLWTMKGANNQPAPEGKVLVDDVVVTDQANNAWEAGQISRKAAGLKSIKFGGDA